MRVLGVVLLPDPGLAARQECRRTMAKQESLRVTAHGAGSSTSRPSASRSVYSSCGFSCAFPTRSTKSSLPGSVGSWLPLGIRFERRRCPLIHEGASASLRRPGERAARLDRAGDRAASRRPTPRGLRGPGPSLRATAPEARGGRPGLVADPAGGFQSHSPCVRDFMGALSARRAVRYPLGAWSDW